MPGEMKEVFDDEVETIEIGSEPTSHADSQSLPITDVPSLAPRPSSTKKLQGPDHKEESETRPAEDPERGLPRSRLSLSKSKSVGVEPQAAKAAGASIAVIVATGKETNKAGKFSPLMTYEVRAVTSSPASSVPYSSLICLSDKRARNRHLPTKGSPRSVCLTRARTR